MSQRLGQQCRGHCLPLLRLGMSRHCFQKSAGDYAGSCSVLQVVAVCCSVLQIVAVSVRHVSAIARQKKIKCECIHRHSYMHDMTYA